MLVCTVDDDELLFLRTSGTAGADRCAALRLGDVLAEEGWSRAAELEGIGKAKLDALVVPDYWIGTASYALESRKKSVVDAFLTRKLQNDHAAVEGIGDLFCYRFFQGTERQRRLHATFVQEQAAVTLYERLREAGIAPQRVTSPALLWEARLAELPEFTERGAALLHLLERECFQYFFDRGRFLFSRHIALPEAGGGRRDGLSEVVHEATQSLHLYSQKARSEIEAVYVLTGRADAAAAVERLSGRLGGEVFDLGGGDEALGGVAELASLGCLEASVRLLATRRAARSAGLMHRSRLRELEWLPVQRAGMAAGLICALFLAGVQIELRQIDGSLEVDLPGAGERARSGAARGLEELRAAVDGLTRRGDHPRASVLLSDVASALPATMTLRELGVEVEGPGKVTLAGRVAAPHIDSLRTTLDRLLADLHESIPGSAGIGMGDVRVNRPSEGEERGAARRQAFEVELELPIR